MRTAEDRQDRRPLAWVLIVAFVLVVAVEAWRQDARDAPIIGAAAAPPTTSAQPPSESWPPKPRSTQERLDERREMVARQIAHPTDGRQPVRDRAVLETMRTVPRHAFVPEDIRRAAHEDSPLPIGHGQTISQPYIVALMTEKLGLGPSNKVLEIGTGSGYQAAVLAHLTPNVYSIEIIQALAERAREALDEQGYAMVQTRAGDGYYGWADAAPFDAIIVTAAAGHVPGPLWEQLAPGGRLVVPIGGPYEVQRLVVLHKQPDGSRRSETVIAVRFVPMTGQIQRD